MTDTTSHRTAPQHTTWYTDTTWHDIAVLVPYAHITANIISSNFIYFHTSSDNFMLTTYHMRYILFPDLRCLCPCCWDVFSALWFGRDVLEKAQDRAPPRNVKLGSCGSAGMRCSIIPDSGTTLLVGPEGPILAIYEALCKSHLVLQLLHRVGL